MQRNWKAKIVATVGPASPDSATIDAMYRAGADVFRLNFSHGIHDDHEQRPDRRRALERATGRPIGILIDLQGRELRVGTFAVGAVALRTGASFRPVPDAARRGDIHRIALPHPEIFAARVSERETIIAATDGVMVARGNLGAAMPAGQVPAPQKRIVRACRRPGKPGIVATRTPESMVRRLCAHVPRRRTLPPQLMTGSMPSCRPVHLRPEIRFAKLPTRPGQNGTNMIPIVATPAASELMRNILASLSQR